MIFVIYFVFVFHGLSKQEEPLTDLKRDSTVHQKTMAKVKK